MNHLLEQVFDWYHSDAGKRIQRTFLQVAGGAVVACLTKYSLTHQFPWSDLWYAGLVPGASLAISVAMNLPKGQGSEPSTDEEGVSETADSEPIETPAEAPEGESEEVNPESDPEAYNGPE